VTSIPQPVTSTTDSASEPFLSWWENLSVLSPIDRQFARLLERLAGGRSPALAVAAALLSRSRSEGHTCLELERLGEPDYVAQFLGKPPEAKLPNLPDGRSWSATLRRLPVVGEPGQFRPLILDRKARLYLQRYWLYEHELARAILARAVEQVDALDEKLLREGVARFFPQHSAAHPDQQAHAAEIAVRRKLAIVSGGPGTGKTRTAAVLLALVLEQASANRCRIALAAPTGKAAARLQESIQQLKSTLPCSNEVKERLPTEAYTLHRLLGAVSGRIRYHAGNALPFEVVVVDEASMVDLALMGKLFAALPAHARLLLLGDRDQLASVEAGSVLGDLCQPGPAGHPLQDCIARLEKNYRFQERDRFLLFSQAVNAGDAARALEVMTHRAPGQAEHGLLAGALPSPSLLRDRLKEWVLPAFREVVTVREPRTAIQALNRVRILVALRHGPYGTQQINAAAEQILGEAGLVKPEEPWYAGRPILITRNDYQLGLYNGDVGVILPHEGQPRAWFLTGDDQLRCYSPARLPAHETVFAMTVHKSQASEFERVWFLLPDQIVPGLTRELIYPGATRARRQLDIWFLEPVLRAAIARRADRSSGLRDALWGPREHPQPNTKPQKATQLELSLP